tara:strand:+ start:77 stop:325 length:249 start_codon:yes stop_codon:yes gene_type:complete
MGAQLFNMSKQVVIKLSFETVPKINAPKAKAMGAQLFIMSKKTGNSVKNSLFVGETGFEPATLRSQSECATGLRHSPFSKDE